MASIPTTTNFNSNNDAEYKLLDRQAQRLSRVFGLPGHRAYLIASLAYEVRL